MPLSTWTVYLPAIILVLFSHFSTAILYLNESTQRIDLSNERLHFSVNKSTGSVDVLTLDGTNLLGTRLVETPTPGGPTGNGNSGIGPYLDCYCVLDGSGSYTPGHIAGKYKTITGTDSAGIKYGGIVMSEAYPKSGQVLEMYWFLREAETGIHTFARVTYPQNAPGPTRQVLQEFRTLFRPNSPIWTHMSTNEELAAPLPRRESVKRAKTVQDAAWDLSNSPDDPYVKEFSNYFTKYTFADTWRNHLVHGLFGDGTGNAKGEEGTWGAWMVMNSRDTYYGGPLHSDLTVDGIVYNYMVSNHHGANVPNITSGFDRTFGPAYYYFNRGSRTAGLAELRGNALKLAEPTWNVEFYNSIAQHVPGYVSPSKRGAFKGRISLPKSAEHAVAILSASGMDVQDNAASANGYQYWSSIGLAGDVQIPAVVPGTYRLTVYAAGVFGEYVQDNIEVEAGNASSPVAITWKEETAGREVWRVGIPDHSAGEFKHGYTRDVGHNRQPAEYRIYWGAYDFGKEFPLGVRFTVGKSTEANDWNYVHWSEFMGRGGENVSDWRILWVQQNSTAQAAERAASGVATLTVQLAGVKTASGNSHLLEDGKKWADLPFTVLVNGQELQAWKIPYFHSSSCAVRSGISCYNTAHKFTFDASLLVAGQNEVVLRLPSRARAVETANLPGQVYVQYDALRLEVEQAG